MRKYSSSSSSHMDVLRLHTLSTYFILCVLLLSCLQLPTFSCCFLYKRASSFYIPSYITRAYLYTFHIPSLFFLLLCLISCGPTSTTESEVKDSCIVQQRRGGLHFPSPFSSYCFLLTYLFYVCIILYDTEYYY